MTVGLRCVDTILRTETPHMEQSKLSCINATQKKKPEVACDLQLWAAHDPVLLTPFETSALSIRHLSFTYASGKQKLWKYL